ncbi:TetR/AcrR family transcriptional regulator [Gordonia sp. VNQ95]|uniref:TetR/AcrR family transcriptional regulator n=1 Tax=Gordonia TaxID=2053 RepID=UPI0032B5245C
MPGRPPGPSLKGAATRQHIIDTAAGIFAVRTYDRARMSEIVAATGMTKGAVYFHFESKEALAVAVLESKHEAWITAVDNSIRTIAPGSARLAALLPAIVDVHRRDPDTWSVSKLTRNLTELDSTHRRAAELTNRWIDLVATVIREAQQIGAVSPNVDPAIAATVFVGAFDGVKAIHDTVSVDDDGPFTEAASFLNEALLHYIAGPEQCSVDPPASSADVVD